MSDPAVEAKFDSAMMCLGRFGIVFRTWDGMGGDEAGHDHESDPEQRTGLEFSRFAGMLMVASANLQESGLPDAAGVETSSYSMRGVLTDHEMSTGTFVSFICCVT